MKNIKTYNQLLSESEEAARPIYVAFAGDSNIYGVGFYDAREEAMQALRDRYVGDDEGFLEDAEAPQTFTLDPKDPKEARELIELAIDAEGVIGPGGEDGAEAHLSEPDEIAAHLLRRLVSLGLGLEDVIGFRHKKGLVLTLERLFEMGLFDGDLDWMPEGEMKAKIRRMKRGKSAFGM
jgi:hypothetical protein